MLKKIVLCIILILSIYSIQAKAEKQCVEVRASFDVGSGSTKLKVAKVNTCLQKITAVLYQQSRKVIYKEDLKLSNKKVFSKEIQKKGLLALEDLLSAAKKFNPKKINAVATSAFRTAKNSKAYVKTIKEKIGLQIKVISQKEEGELGFIGATAYIKDYKIHEFLVWDIGGGSMQFSWYENQKIKTIGFQMASVPFKNKIISSRGLDPKKVFSPNPMNIEDIKVGKQVAQKIRKKLEGLVQKKIKKVIGIGGVHNYPLKRIINKVKYAQYDVLNAYHKYLNFTDVEIGGAYPETDVSNLLLVYSLMKALNIHDVEIYPVNLADGLLVRK
jgi:exopolyphosphatase/guanosine-5'-triphosphate,3'-diphosphate pyrophosphatase